MSERETRHNSDAGESPGGETDFGFRRVPETDKATLVRAVFDSVAARYDLMNDLMRAGIHRWWKAEMVALLQPGPRPRARRRHPRRHRVAVRRRRISARRRPLLRSLYDRVRPAQRDPDRAG